MRQHRGGPDQAVDLFRGVLQRLHVDAIAADPAALVHEVVLNVHYEDRGF